MKRVCVVYLCCLALLLGACDDDESSEASNSSADSDAGLDAGDQDSATGGDSETEVDSAVGGDAEVASFASITALEAKTYAQVHNMSGLTFAADKIYGAGYSLTNADDPETVIMRFNADGTLDETFATGGVLQHNVVVGGAEEALAIVVLSDGEMVVGLNVDDGLGGEEIADDNGGEAGQRPDGRDAVLVRFKTDGTLNADFGDAGVLRLALGWDSAADANWPVPTYDTSMPEGEEWSGDGFPRDRLFDVLLDTTGEAERLVVFATGPAVYDAAAGESQRYDNDRYIVRLMADGTVDSSFNGDGSAYSLDLGGALNDNGRRGWLESDGSIVSGGYTNLGGDELHHVVLIRLLADGTPDPAFGFGLDPAIDGVAVFNPFKVDGGYSECYGVVMQSTGVYVTTGYGGATGAETESTLGYQTTEAQDIVVFGLTGTGLASSFATDGAAALQSELVPGTPSNEDRGRALVVLPDDRTIHAGRFGGMPALGVMTPDGGLDSAQGQTGLFLYDEENIESQFYAIAVSADGTRVAATTDTDTDGVILAVLEIE